MAKIRILAGKVDRSSGSAGYHYSLAEKLADRGHEVSVVCFSAEPGLREFSAVHELGVLNVCTLPFAWRFSYAIEAAAYHLKMLMADLEAPDLVIGGEHLLLVPHKWKFPETPCVYLPHSVIVREEIRSYGLSPLQERVGIFMYSRIQRWALVNSDRVMRFTRKGGEVLESEYRMKLGSRLIVNPVGIDIPPRRGRRSGGKLRLLSVGRLVESKNLPLVVRSLSGLRSHDWEFHIVGDGNDRGSLQRLVSDERLQDRIHFHGYCRDVSGWYSKTDLLLFPSRLESLGLVICEAMSYGIPVLAMQPEGNAYNTVTDEIISDGKTGWLAASEDDFRERIGRILEDPSVLATMGSAARAAISEKYTWEKHLQSYESLIPC